MTHPFKKLTDLLTNLQVNVVDEKAAVRQETLVMCGVPNSPELVEGSQQYVCHFCKGPVWFSPVSQTIISARAPDSTRLVCTECLHKLGSS